MCHHTESWMKISHSVISNTDITGELTSESKSMEQLQTQKLSLNKKNAKNKLAFMEQNRWPSC